MSRQSFWLGFCAGALTLAIGLMGVQHWPQSTPQVPSMLQQTPQPTLRHVVDLQEFRRSPSDWERHEFNGQEFYIVPLADASDPTDR